MRIRPYRCHDCGRRFFAATQPKSEGSGESPQSGGEAAEPQVATSEISSESNPHQTVDTRA
ncbi:MAG: hypothetical protein WB795_06135 [Candidatus Acidiferrales bacterium]